MSRKKSVKTQLPALGIVFGSGVGALAAILYSSPIAAGMIGGAVAGLLFGIIGTMMYGMGRGS